MSFGCPIFETRFMDLQPADLDGMPTISDHKKRTWYNDRNGSVMFSQHMPTSGMDTYSLMQKATTTFRRATGSTLGEGS